MPLTLLQCKNILAAEGIRHHVDDVEGAIRIVFLTRGYRNLRDENFAVVTLATPDDGRRCRLTIERAFTPGRNAAAACLALCRHAAGTPCVGVEYDAAQKNLRLVTEAVVEDGDLTPLQLLTMVDQLVAAAETAHAALEPGSRKSSGTAAA